MKLLIMIFSVFMLSMPLQGFAQIASQNIVDDGGSLKISPNQPQQNAQSGPPPQQGPNSRSAQPPQRGVPAGDSTSVQLPPGAAQKVPDNLDKDQLMQEYQKYKDKLPPEMQNMSPEQVMQYYQKMKGR